MARDEEMTAEEAEEVIRRHEKKHGHEMRGPDRADDVPTKAERDDPPGWAKRGEKRPAHPDD